MTPLLHRLHPELSQTLPHLALGTRPTPVRRLTALGAGADLWVKDDSAFGDGGWGGNKVRKLEWLLPDALRRGRRTIVTVGGLGTNWGLATALYGREHGLKTVLALVDQPVDDHVRRQLERLRASGAELHLTHTRARTVLAAPLLLARHFSGMRPPYPLPAGGSSPVGALGYVEAALELADQVRSGELPEPTHLVTPVGSGGTVAGLALGLRLAGLSTRVVGVVVNDTLRLDHRTLTRLTHRTARLLRRRGARLPETLTPTGNLEVVTDWLGTGYGHPTSAGEAARRRAAGDEHLELEPVYTAKALAALLDLDARGHFDGGPVVYLNTNGPR
ncbi:1-aminocyclopropane-1-carboxylate deaminase/D-cysteine desulfhydrase [Nocardia otitidiscaviarum]|uniref:1-aminocyclopropane-1-carboxylate deaminase/D-cysteine desulfhydrase n=1 Tax=Nocardia otitidiscaviarum TaxID=1823 RepID=UPI0018950D2E|nr:pyridoxal-phosphate dependent enzyme [Nocardia otitidiscaviarum]MBF6239282.1 pyridoxal-phosphate dependent enzyme [Nocardia otitidiscaviarum]